MGPAAAGTQPQHGEGGQRQQPRPARSDRPFALRRGPSAGAAPLSARSHGRRSPDAPGAAGRSRSLPVPAAPGAVHDWSCSPCSGRTAAGRAAGAQPRAPRSSPRSAAADRRRRSGRCAPAREVLVVAAAAAPGGEVGQSAGGKMVGGGRGGSGRLAAAGAARSAPFPALRALRAFLRSVPLCPSGLPGAAPCPGDLGTRWRGASSRQERPLRAEAAGRSPGAGARGRSTAPRTFPFFGLRCPAPQSHSAASPGPGRLRAPPRREAAGTAVLPSWLRRRVPRWGCSSWARSPETPPRPRRERAGHPSHAVGNSQGSESSERAAACSPRVTPLRGLRPLVAELCRHCPRGSWCARGGVRSGGILTVRAESLLKEPIVAEQKAVEDFLP